MSIEKQDGFAVVYVRLKDGVLDPQGSTIERALDDMGYQGIKQIRSGKFAVVSYFLLLGVAYMFLESYHLPFPTAFGLSLVFAVLLGMAIEFLFLRQAENPTILGLIVITLGCEMILYGFAAWKWGAEQKSLPFPVSDTTILSPSLTSTTSTLKVPPSSMASMALR